MKVEDIERVGDNIKGIRKRKGLTISKLGLYTGLSVGYLSNVERNQTSPTLRDLNLISNSLEVSITELIESKAEEKVVIRKEDSLVRYYPEYNMSIDVIDFNISMGVYTYITIDPGKTKDVADFMHAYSEVCTVLEGELTILMNNQEYILKKGDCIYIKGHIEHTMLNNSKKKCVSFWHRKHPNI